MQSQPLQNSDPATPATPRELQVALLEMLLREQQTQQHAESITQLLMGLSGSGTKVQPNALNDQLRVFLQRYDQLNTLLPLIADQMVADRAQITDLQKQVSAHKQIALDHSAQLDGPLQKLTTAIERIGQLHDSWSAMIPFEAPKQGSREQEALIQKMRILREQWATQLPLLSNAQQELKTAANTLKQV